MAPFSSKMTRSDPRQTLTIMLIPIAVLGIVLLFYFQDNPSSTFKSDQKALVKKDWQTALELSDENTQAYL